MGERIGVSDEEWALIGPLQPPEHGRGCRPAGDNRRYFEGMMWMARSGAQWRLLPDDYGKWNSVFWRYSRPFWETLCIVSRSAIITRPGRSHVPPGSGAAPETRPDAY